MARSPAWTDGRRTGIMAVSGVGVVLMMRRWMVISVLNRRNVGAIGVL